MATLEKILKAKGIDISKLKPVPSPEPPEPPLTQDGVDIQEKLEEQEQNLKSQMIEDELVDTLTYQNKIIRSQPRGRVRIVPAIPKPEPVRSLFERRENMEVPKFKTNSLFWKIFTLLFTKTEGITHQEIYDALIAQGTKTTFGSVGTATRQILLYSDKSVLWKVKEMSPKGGSLRDRYHYNCPKGKTITDLYNDFLTAKKYDRRSTGNVGGDAVSETDRKKIDITGTEKEKIILSAEKGQESLGVTDQEKAALGADIGQEVMKALIQLPENITVKLEGSVDVNINITFTLGK